MSLYKIDGHTFSVNEFFSWVVGFVTLFRKGKLRHTKLPEGIVKILHDNHDDKEAAKAIMGYLKDDENYFPHFLEIVKNGIAEMAYDKMDE